MTTKPTSRRLPEVNSGITTTWIPFTTPSPPLASGCSSQIYRVPGSSELVAFDPYFAKNVPKAAQCLPSEVMKIWEWEQGSTGPTKFSLGPFNCPSLYTPAATASLNAISTILACCPSQYIYRADSKCISTVGSRQVLVVDSPSGGLAPRADPTGSAASTIVTGFMVTGYVFADDIAPSPITTIAAPSVASSNPPGVAAPRFTSPSIATLPNTSSTPTSSHTASSATPLASSNGLNVGAKVGITISVVFVIITAVALLAGLHIKRRRNKQRGRKEGQGEVAVIERQLISREEQQQPPPPQGQEHELSKQQPEMQRQRQQEMAGFQMALSPDMLGTFETRVHPPTRSQIDPGPFEMEVQEKYEMDAGDVDGSMVKGIPITDERERDVRQARPEHMVEVGYDEIGTAIDTPGIRPNNVIVSQDRCGGCNSFGRTTPDRTWIRDGSTTPDRSGVSNSFVRAPDKFGSGNGRTPDRYGVGRSLGRTTREGMDSRSDVPGGCISPNSTAERSFLDLSDGEDSN
ncbi:uncharacterized protein BP5553_04386 [Venustampulla echinocandica]|uniref:Uncharacterized protein n=1 Tax=Venustampulla echinocandica TaxID=2656787 RepID=A0A370TN35_9HELO|nr:uncharacterized protein BP5553_04386 [Venustampulla echinocandica]RDL36953.1 hypothetical protein BP5553_04386 [Venustampulla echinocandica]